MRDKENIFVTHRKTQVINVIAIYKDKLLEKVHSASLTLHTTYERTYVREKMKWVNISRSM